MSVIVTTPDQTVNVTRGDFWNVTQFALNVFDAEGEQVATFREWEAVHHEKADTADTADNLKFGDSLTVTIPWPPIARRGSA